MGIVTIFDFGNGIVVFRVELELELGILFFFLELNKPNYYHSRICFLIRILA